MNQLNNRVQISEIKGYKNIMFILENDNDFSMMQYKVLQNNVDKGYLKCAKSLFNGKVKLVYFTNQKKTLKEMLPMLHTEELVGLIKDILQTLIDIKKNGFLNCMNVELDSNRVYVKLESMTAELIYLPVDVAETPSTDFEKKMSAFLVGVFGLAPRLPKDLSGSICEGLLSMPRSIEEIKIFIEEEFNSFDSSKRDYEDEEISIVSELQEVLQFSCKDFGTKCTFNITKSEFVIGKKEDAVDGHIGFNAAISRVHCKVVKMEDSFYIIDMKSANGTFVNDERIESQKAFRISNGDIVRLANSEFEVKII